MALDLWIGHVETQLGVMFEMDREKPERSKSEIFFVFLQKVSPAIMVLHISSLHGR